MVAKQQMRFAQLESLRALIQKKEEEVSHEHTIVILYFLTVYPQLRSLRLGKQVD